MARAAPAGAAKETAPNLRQALLGFARESSRPIDTRLDALAAIQEGLSTVDPELFDFLQSALSVSQPPAVRVAASGIVEKARLSPEQLLALARTLESAGPLELARLLPAFDHSADETVGLQMVAALERSKSRSGVRPDLLRPRLTKYPETVQRRGEALLASLNADSAKQAQRLESMLASLGSGDVRRGQDVFNSTKAACFSCHAIGYMGGRIGPDLTRIGQVRGERDLSKPSCFRMPASRGVRAGQHHDDLRRGARRRAARRVARRGRARHRSRAGSAHCQTEHQGHAGGHRVVDARGSGRSAHPAGTGRSAGVSQGHAIGGELVKGLLVPMVRIVQCSRGPTPARSRSATSRLARAAGALLFAVTASVASSADQAKRATSIFDGKTFAGWEGNLKIFRIQDGAIVGGSLDGSSRNEFLCTTKTYGDFELRLKFKLLGAKAPTPASSSAPNASRIITRSRGTRPTWAPAIGARCTTSRGGTRCSRARPGQDEERHQAR